MRILLNDYSGHPFSLELSQHLSEKFNVLHSYAGYFESPKANFDIKKKKNKIKIIPIHINKKFKKDNFFFKKIYGS